MAGDVPRAQLLADDLERRFPEDTFARFTYVPVLRALAALGRGKPSDTVEQLRAALPYELAVNGVNFNFYLGGLYSGYVRGEAFLAAHQYADAITEFQKLLEHRGIVGTESDRRLGAPANWQSPRRIGRHGESRDCLPGLPRSLEGRRSGRPDPPAGQDGILAAAMTII